MMIPKTRKKIAIIGSGISGLAAAYMLHPHHDITVYEKNNYIGGHSRTVEVTTPQGDVVAVDTGFIVFNHRNYPLLSSLFKHLDVPVVESNMSFGTSIDNGWLEYGTQSLFDMFAQKRNLLRPAFWQMIRDIMRFNRLARDYLSADPGVTLAACLDALKMGPWFREYYLLAMGGAIWSTPLTEMLAFPAAAFIRFFDNHGLLTVSDQPQWLTVKGGSKEYVKRLTAGFRDGIRLRAAVVSVSRTAGGIVIIDHTGANQLVDEVIFACHADQALRMITNPSDEEQRLLGAFHYQPNRMVLHSDTSFMPKRRSAWSSWVYLSETTHDDEHQLSLSYWMNNLQPLQTKQPVIVTLNPGREPAEHLVHDEYWFEHPLFDASAIAAQAEIDNIQGQDRFWFCGAYQRYGFHEDGLLSAVTMARHMGIKPSWI